MSPTKSERDESRRWSKVEALFHQAMQVEGPQRPSLIGRLSKGDAALIAELETLLDAAQKSEQFLEDPDYLCSSLFTQVIRDWSAGRVTGQAGSVNPHDLGQSGSDALTSENLEATGTKEMDFETASRFLKEHLPELRVEGLAGEGAAGVVVRVFDERLQRNLAVKFLRPEWIKRFGDNYLEREAQAASLTSDHVVRVYDVAPRGSPIPYIIMEWISGPSLRAVLADQNAMRPTDAARIAYQLSLGLGAAHHLGLIHGDIKPANVMLEPIAREQVSSDRSGFRFGSHQSQAWSVEGYRAKLTDFGSADRRPPHTEIAADFSAVNKRSFVGTPAYASPDQLLDGLPVDELSDLWSLGATLYHMLVGTPPNTGRLHAIIRQMRWGNPVSPRDFDARIPRDLDSICQKALSRNRTNRYRCAQEFSEDLTRYLEGLPVNARPLPAPLRMWRTIRRYPSAATLIGMLLIALATGALLSNFFRIRAERNLSLAKDNFRLATVERDRAKAVVELLQGMISSADTNYGNREVTLVQALQGLENRIAAELHGQPGIEADLRSTLGKLYFSLADYDPSRRNLERAIQLRNSIDDPQTTIEDRIHLANTLRWLYLPEDALALGLDNRQRAIELLGASHLISLHAGEVLAGCYQDMHRYAEAESIYKEVIAISTQAYGTGHERTLSCRSGLASSHIDAGSYTTAEQELRSVIAEYSDTDFAGARELLTLLSNLSVCLMELGRPDEAIEKQREIAGMSHRALGPLHDSTLTSEMNLADSLRRVDKIADALELSHQITKRCIEGLGWTHSGTLRAVEGLVLMQLRSMQFQEALLMVESALAQIDKYGFSNQDFYYRLQALKAAALSGKDLHDEALSQYEECVEYFRSRYGDADSQTLTVLNNYGSALMKADRSEQAVTLFNNILSLIAGKFDSMHPVVLRNLGKAQLMAGQSEAARRSLTSALELSQARGEIENAKICAQLLEASDRHRQ